MLSTDPGILTGNELMDRAGGGQNARATVAHLIFRMDTEILAEVRAPDAVE